MIYELFVVGGILFWTLTLGILCTLIVCMDLEFFNAATVSVVLYVLAINLFGNAQTIPWIKDHSALAVIYTVSYLFIGVIWSFGKWYFFNKEISEKVLVAKRNLLGQAADENTEIPEDKRHEWYFQYLSNIRDKSGNRFVFPIRALNHKGRIMSWMAYWPISAAWTLLDDFVRNIYRKIYSLLQARYEAITNKVFGKFHDNDFALVSNPSPIEKDVNSGGWKSRREVG